MSKYGEVTEDLEQGGLEGAVRLRRDEVDASNLSSLVCSGEEGGKTFTPASCTVHLTVWVLEVSDATKPWECSAPCASGRSHQ